MRTQIISEHGLGLPWLEYLPVKDGPPEQAILDKSPFVIGRGESADLQVVSHGVSREHATIVSEGRICRIRDLGSTNGTFVNGQRIREADLRDGDMVQVANVELVFYVGKAPSRQTMVTQVLPPDADGDAGEDPRDAAQDLRRGVRRLHEMLVRGCVQGRYKPIIDLRQGDVAGYEILEDEVLPASPGNDPRRPTIPGRVAARVRHLRRMRGIEKAVATEGKKFVLLSVQPAEITSGRFLEWASTLCELVPDANRLVLAVPLGTVKESAPALAPGSRLRELGVAVALSNLGGKDAGAALLEEIRPEFARLAASLICGAAGNSPNSRALQTMIRTAEENGTRVIAAGIGSPTERAACVEAGCTLGQGALFEEPKRAEVPARRSNVAGLPVAPDSFYLSLALDSIERA
jgi:EAL domain-containing protein (putative c-di-GMP-specific phosphodiesterase class I)